MREVFKATKGFDILLQEYGEWSLPMSNTHLESLRGIGESFSCVTNETEEKTSLQWGQLHAQSVSSWKMCEGLLSQGRFSQIWHILNPAQENGLQNAMGSWWKQLMCRITDKQEEEHLDAKGLTTSWEIQTRFQKETMAAHKCSTMSEPAKRSDHEAE